MSPTLPADAEDKTRGVQLWLVVGETFGGNWGLVYIDQALGFGRWGALALWRFRYQPPGAWAPDRSILSHARWGAPMSLPENWLCRWPRRF